MVSKEILTRLPGTGLRSVSHCILPPTRPILATAAKRWKSGLVKGTNPTCKRNKSDLQKSKSDLQKEHIRLAKGANPTCRRRKSDLQILEIRTCSHNAVPEQSTRAVAIHTFHSGDLLRSARQKLSFCHRSCRHILFVAEKKRVR